jgi:hypothetical protein
MLLEQAALVTIMIAVTLITTVVAVAVPARIEM